MKPKLFYLLIVLIFVCIGRNVSAQNGNELELREGQIQLVKNFTNAIINKDFNAMEDLLHENYVGYGPFINTQKNKMQEIAEWKQVWGEQVLSAEYNRTHIIPVTIEEGDFAGDWVMDYAVVKATYAIRPNTQVTFLFHAAHKIIDDQIAETYNYFNAADVRQQLGL